MAKKKQKLDRVPVIHRRLFRLWSEKIRERCNSTCEFCGIKKGELNENQKVVKIDSHHFISRKIKDFPLKYCLSNGIGLCPTCHKWGEVSFHRNPVATITWLIAKHSDRYTSVLQRYTERVDLENRAVLEEIEKMLTEGKCLDIQRLKEIEAANPRKTETKIEGSLFEEDKPKPEVS